MVSASTLLVFCALSAPQETVLLEFSQAGCAHCRTMEPIVARLTSSGYPIRTVRAEREPDLVRQHHVSAFPTFVMLAAGRPVDRVEGAASAERLQRMFQAAGYRPGGRAILPREYERLLAASVRLTIDDAKGSSYGSGTIVDQRDGSALVLTCGHIFRDSQGHGRITVEVFDSTGPHQLAGELLKYNLPRDIGLVVIQPTEAVTTVRVAPKGHRLLRGDRVISVGCNHGNEPSVQETQVTALDKFLGPANIEVAGQPQQGRSGGGLFTTDGLLIGVCNAADPTDNEGLYAAATTIQTQLDEIGMAEVYRQTPTRLAVAPKQRGSSDDSSDPPPMPEPLARGEGRLAANARPRRSVDQGLSAREQEALAQLRDIPDGAEVICIIRPVNNPQAKSDVIVLDRASPTFLDLLASERQNQDARHLTSLSVERTAEPDPPSRPQRR